MKFSLNRIPGKTWFETAMEIAAKYGLEEEVRESFRSAEAEGRSQQEAAFSSLYEWDCITGIAICTDEEGKP